MRIWKVKYTSTFTSSQGMKTYRIEHGERECFVLTEGDSLTDVKKEMEMTGGEGLHFHIKEALFLGISYNDIQRVK
jgi:hypothetical protein